MSDGEWTAVASAATEEEAAVVVGFLQSQGITAIVDSERFDQVPVNFGDLDPIAIRVPAEFEARATTLLSAQSAPALEEE